MGGEVGGTRGNRREVLFIPIHKIQNAKSTFCSRFYKIHERIVVRVRTYSFALSFPVGNPNIICIYLYVVSNIVLLIKSYLY